MNITPFEAYKLFTALKQHFTTSYDFFKYHGKTRANIKSFEQRRDKYQYAKLGKLEDPQAYLIANFAKGSVGWVGNLLSEECQKTFIEYKNRLESLAYIFTSDINKIADNFSAYFKVIDGQHPLLLNLYKTENISIETLVILNDFIDFYPHWDKKIIDPIIWPEIKLRTLKYRSFLHYDKPKLKQIIKQTIKEN